MTSQYETNRESASNLEPSEDQTSSLRPVAQDYRKVTGGFIQPVPSVSDDILVRFRKTNGCPPSRNPPVVRGKVA